MASTEPKETGALTANSSRLEVFFDGDCPLCVREVEMLREKDEHGSILFTDIAAVGFSPAALGLTQQQMMAEIHARARDGEIIVGVEVFRQMYQLVGFDRSVALSRLFGVRQVLDVGYRIWAKNRLKLTGRCDGEVCA